MDPRSFLDFARRGEDAIVLANISNVDTETLQKALFSVKLDNSTKSILRRIINERKEN